MNLITPPITEDIKVLKGWCDDLYEFLKYPSFNGIITPQMYGAVGDGTTDDTIAFQSAISDAINGYTYAKEINVPWTANGYLITDSLFKNITAQDVIGFKMKGVGGMPLLTFTPSTEIDFFDLRIGDRSALDSSSGAATTTYTWYNCTWENMALVAGNTTARNGIYYINTYNCKFKNLHVSSFYNTDDGIGDGIGGSVGIRGGGYWKDATNSVYTNSYKPANDQQSVFDNCYVYNNLIGMVIYDGTSELYRTWFYANHLCNYYQESGRIFINKCYIRDANHGNKSAAMTGAAQIIINGGDAVLIQGNKFDKLADSPADVLITQKENHLTPYIKEPAGATTYCRAVRLVGNHHEEAASHASDNTGTKSFIVIGETGVTNAVDNITIKNNSFIMKNSTATPFGASSSYVGNVPAYIAVGSAAKKVEWSGNHQENAVTDPLFSTGVIKYGDRTVHEFFSTDWQVQELVFRYHRAGTDVIADDTKFEPIEVTGSDVAVVNTGYMSPGHLMLLGIDVYTSHTIVNDVGSTFIRLYINGDMQDIGGSQAYPKLNIAADGDRDLTAPAFNILSVRYPPFCVQWGENDVDTANQFIEAEFGELIEVATESWGADFLDSGDGGGFDVYVRTIWANRRTMDVV